jgi:hypothetical protein
MAYAANPLRAQLDQHDAKAVLANSQAHRKRSESDGIGAR